ncbi:MAG TPA: MFS transporter, partial [Brevundimonas sp.]|nr:MFS transporter [Brevundimonas sp.]
MCVGFFGIQIGFGLQNANTSRIFQTLGAEVDSLAILWIAAPLTGLLVQPIVGHFSDRTWTRLGRRRPYFLVGAILTTLALVVMPHSPWLWMAASMLWIMDASINITMEPFRAFVGDNLPEEQRTTGYAMQSFFIGAGAVFASCLPWMLTEWFDVASTAPEGVVPMAVRISFYVGAAALLAAVLWTVFTTREYSPEQIEAFESARDAGHAPVAVRARNAWYAGGVVWAFAGALGVAAVAALGLQKELYVLAGFILAFGLMQMVVGALAAAGRSNALTEIMADIFAMPKTMQGLAVVQFFSW